MWVTTTEYSKLVQMMVKNRKQIEESIKKECNEYGAISFAKGAEIVKNFIWDNLSLKQIEEWKLDSLLKPF
jgi:hypothetical protein